MSNQVLGAIITYRFTQRQIKILLLIARFSFGYHKSYAVLSRSDFAVAGIASSAITEQLERLAALRVIHWIPSRNQLWINRNVAEWAVSKPVNKRGRMLHIAHNNAADRNFQISQIENIRVANSGTHKKDSNNKGYRNNEQSDDPYVQILRQYVKLVAPVTTSEAVILREVIEAYEQDQIMAAIVRVSGSNNRSLSNFLRTLDQIAGPREHGRFGQLRARLERYLKMIPGP